MCRCRVNLVGHGLQLGYPFEIVEEKTTKKEENPCSLSSST